MDAKIELVSSGLLTVREAEEMSGMRKSFLYGRMSAGDLPYVKIGSARRIPKKALLELLAVHLVVRNEP